MAKNIALGINVKINGTQTAVKSIDELEQAIVGLESELKTAEFGSQKFKQLTKEVGGLKAGLRDIQREAEGVDVTQEFELFASSVNGITGAFLVATSAIQAFGIEGKNAEELNKIQARALAAVNFALGIRAVLEARVKFGLLQKNIAEKASAAGTFLLTTAQAAYTVVVGASTGALKAFRIALATTGIGALVVGLGILVSKLFDYVSTTEEAVEETKTLSEFQLEAAQSAAVETQKIEQLNKVIKQAEVPLKDRVAAYKELQKLVPELAGYTLEEAENLGILNRAIEDQIELIQLRATVRGLEDFLAEQVKLDIAEKIAIENAKKKTEAIQEYLDIQEEARRIVGGMGAATMEEALAQIEARKAYYETGQEVKKLTTVEEALLEAQTKLSAKQGEIDGRIKKRTDLTKDGNKVDTERNKLLAERAKLLNDAAVALGKETLQGKVSVKVLDDANEILEKQNDLLLFRTEILQEQKTANETLAEDFKRLIGGVVIPEKDFKGFRDQFVELFDGINKTGTDAKNQYQQLVDLVIKAGGAEEVRKLIGEESLEILQDYFETNIILIDRLEDYNEKAILDNKEIANINVDINKLVKEIADIQQAGTENLEQRAVTQQKINDLVVASIFPQLQGKVLTEEQQVAVDNITKGLTEQAGIYRGIVSVQQQLVDLSEKVTKNTDEQKGKLDDIEFKNLRQFFIDNADAIGTLDEEFKKIQEGTSNLTADQIENINTLIDNIKLNELLDDINEIAQAVVGIFTSASSQLAGIVSAQNSLLLEQLAYDEAIALETIGDADEDARKEQAIAQEKYAKQRFEIEKSARVSELQFSKADALANSAAAYIAALTVAPPAGFILAQITAGLAIAQIATIQSQINFTKSKQYVGRRGGLISGNSHELGGVDMGGGLNLEGGEFVMNRSAVGEFGDILSQMSTSTGGRPLAMDDSRIVEEIRKQNQRPIKTYVLDSDITEARKINSRLSEISRL